MVYVGIDNGTSGSIGVVDSEGLPLLFMPVPVVKQQDYIKARRQISRIDFPMLLRVFQSLIDSYGQLYTAIERPMVNPRMFRTAISAVRALEVVLIVLETVKCPYEFADSRQWQKVMLPKGYAGPELKKASLDTGVRLFPGYAECISKQKDADSLLMAEWLRRVRRRLE
jgi:hypothetical protein